MMDKALSKLKRLRQKERFSFFDDEENKEKHDASFVRPILPSININNKESIKTRNKPKSSF